uniref:GAT domain-containing protein n=1 Tax=Caenorhabditis tropicalis TaxID=1561998 RepID=A0A1I7UP66_9PELO
MISRIFKGCEVYPSALDKMHMFPMSKSQKKSQKRKNRKEKERLAKLNPDTVYEDDFEEEDEEDLEASESQISGSMSEMPHDIEKQIDEDLAKFAEELEIEDEKEDGKKNSKEEKIQLLKRHYQMVSNESKALVAEIKKLREQLELQQGLQEMNPDEKDDIIKEMTDECNKYMAVLHNIHVSDREALEKYDSENHDLKLKITHQQETINQLIKSLKTSD